MGSDSLWTDFGINRNSSDWFGMNFNRKLLPGGIFEIIIR